MALVGNARDVETLVGLPRSPLPMLIALLAAAVALIAVACILLWRMIDLTRVRADFTSSVSHELRTPLTQIQLFADTMRMGRNESPEAQQRLAELAGRLKNENKNVYLEIQGYTDSTGTPDYNERLGEQRAEAVRRYLSSQGVALNRMATISYGQDQPVAPNDTREGRAQNRRVAIVVLS